MYYFIFFVPPFFTGQPCQNLSKMATTPATQNVVIDTASLSPSTSSSIWDRISNWVSENKAVVYTVAGIAVVVTGGTVYYLSTSSKPQEPAQPKKSKKQRRNEKKKAEEEKKAQETKAAEGEIITF